MKQEQVQSVEDIRKRQASRTRYRVTVLLFLVLLISVYFFEHREFPETGERADRILLVILVVTTGFLWTKEREQQTELQSMMEQVLAGEARLRDYSVRTIEALVLALEAKNPESRGHSRAVARIAGCIGKELGFTSARLDTLIHSALLHDLASSA